jgi:mono/diheme cytochrome c family protein
VNSANVLHLRRLGLAIPFGLLLLAGCGDYSAYPEDIKYPVRTDPIVKKPSQTSAWYPDPPGALDEARQHLLGIQRQQQALSDSVAKLTAEKDDAQKPPSADRQKQIEGELARLDQEMKRLEGPLNEARARAWAETLLDPQQIPEIDPVKYKLFERSLASLRSDGVSDEALSKLSGLQNKDFESDQAFVDSLAKLFPDNRPLQDQVLKVAVKQPRERLDRTTLGRALEEVFGTPRGPTVSSQGNDTAASQLESLKLNPALLAQGSVLYRRFCLQCHGITGDGRGPTGPWVHPHPRDYRQGIFKFISTQNPETQLSTGKPSRDDLRRVLTTGVEGTSMPSFALLGDDALEALISYVMHLSIRGEVELTLCKDLLKDTTFKPDSETLLDEARVLTAEYVKNWFDANRENWTIKPVKNKKPESETERQESIKRGYRLFIGAQGGCVKCHIDFGRQVPFKADDWGTPVRPANLTNNLYRGGRRPIDVYWRIRAGIAPAGMPAGAALMKPASGEGDELDAQIWDVVNFVQALPYPAMLPEEVRKKIYVEGEN